MFHLLSNFFYNNITKKTLLVFVILYCIIGFGIIPYKSIQMQKQYGEELKPFDLTFGYDKSFADTFFTTLGKNGRKEYLQFVGIYDSIYPIIYGGLLLTVLTLLIGRSSYKSKMRLLNLLPILIVLIDYGENICSIYNTTNYPNYSLKVLKIGSMLTQTKWSLVAVVFIIIIYFGYISIKDRKSNTIL